jgi:hypothetical protein
LSCLQRLASIKTHQMRQQCTNLGIECHKRATGVYIYLINPVQWGGCFDSAACSDSCLSNFAALRL